MSRLSRVTSLLFGSLAGPTQVGVFGSLANGSPTYSTNPANLHAKRHR